jgi:hypothetical protein
MMIHGNLNHQEEIESEQKLNDKSYSKDVPEELRIIHRLLRESKQMNLNLTPDYTKLKWMARNIFHFVGLDRTKAHIAEQTTQICLDNAMKTAASSIYARSLDQLKEERREIMRNHLIDLSREKTKQYLETVSKARCYSILTKLISDAVQPQVTSKLSGWLSIDIDYESKKQEHLQDIIATVRSKLYERFKNYLFEAKCSSNDRFQQELYHDALESALMEVMNNSRKHLNGRYEEKCSEIIIKSILEGNMETIIEQELKDALNELRENAVKEALSS